MKYQTLEELNRIHGYIMQMRPVFHKHALFSDGTADYRNPAEPKENEDVTIRFRTGTSNVDMVRLCCGDEKIRMEVAETEGEYDYYEAVLHVGTEPVNYYFEVTCGMIHCYYDRSGISKEYRPQYDFRIVPGFSTPDWAKGAVMYQIFVERFCNGDTSNDVLSREYYYINRQTTQVENWDKTPNGFDVADFYGGDLAGVMKKLDYLQKLGVEVLYFNPIFASASSHKYDTQDYDHVDPHFGVILDDEGALLEPGDVDNTHASRFISRVTSKRNLEASNELFIQLVEEAHKRGMRVILDGVFNHCGSFNKWLDRERIYEGCEGFQTGAYVSADSPYRNFFKFSDENGWPNNQTYEGWWGHNTLPKLNYEGSRELEEYILEVGRKWVSPPYNVDGWRLDVAADLGHTPEYNHEFWKKFRKTVKEAKPDALILAEHYGDPKEWLKGDQWDSVMNYDAFMEPVTWFLTGMEKHSDEYKDFMVGDHTNFINSMNHYMSSFMTSSLQCAMNQLSNHDHSRFLTRTNHKVGRLGTLGAEAASEGINKGIFKEAVVIQMTWPGAPTLYYGDEAGVCGFTDPDNRRTYPWGNEDQDLLKFHRDMIKIHREYPALKTGSLKMFECEKHVLCYSRFNRRQQIVVVLNNDAYPKNIDVSIASAGIPRNCKLKQLMYTHGDSYSTMPVEYKMENKQLKMHLPKYSAVVLLHENE